MKSLVLVALMVCVGCSRPGVVKHAAAPRTSGGWATFQEQWDEEKAESDRQLNVTPAELLAYQKMQQQVIAQQPTLDVDPILRKACNGVSYLWKPGSTCVQSSYDTNGHMVNAWREIAACADDKRSLIRDQSGNGHCISFGALRVRKPQ